MFSGVSIIVPVYLSKKDKKTIELLNTALESILTQECPIPLEILLIDDGSSTPLLSLSEAVPAIHDPRIRVITLPLNLKLVMALNIGLKAAKYDLIARLDADDSWRPVKLLDQLARFKSDPSLTLVATSMRFLHDDSSKDWDEIRHGPWAKIHQFFDDVGSPFPHGSILARKEIFNFLGGYPTDPLFAHCEDFALWLTWIRFFNCDTLSKVYLDYHVHPNSVSATFSELQSEGSKAIARKYKSWNLTPDYHTAYSVFSKKWGTNLIDTGKWFFLAWNYFEGVCVEESLKDAAQLLLPDRKIVSSPLWRFADLTQIKSETSISVKSLRTP